MTFMNKKFITVIELPEFQKFAKAFLNEKECTEIVNYIAGMTDAYAIKQYQRLLHLPRNYSFVQNL